MRSNKIAVLALTLMFAGMIGCSNEIPGDPDSEFDIGVPASSISMLSNPGSEEATKILVFDKTVRRVHQFDIQTMQHVKSFDVPNSDQDHAVLYSQQGDYAIDFAKKNVSVFDKHSVGHPQDMGLQGKPKSVAFNPKAGVLVICDDQMSVGILKVDNSGNVVSSWTGGPVMDNSTSIFAGDLNSTGQLILGMSDGSIVNIDIDKTLAKGDWVSASQTFQTGLTEISWVAPIPGSSSLVLVRSLGQISLVDTVARSVVTSISFSGTVEKLSKFQDPHVLVRHGNERTIFYVNGSNQLVSITLAAPQTTLPNANEWYEIDGVLQSRLDLKKGTWTVIDTTKAVTNIFDNPDEATESRKLKRYHFPDFRYLGAIDVPSNAQVQIASHFIFNLLPSKLGYATRVDLSTNETAEAKFFNLKDLDKH